MANSVTQSVVRDIEIALNTASHFNRGALGKASDEMFRAVCSRIGNQRNLECGLGEEERSDLATICSVSECLLYVQTKPYDYETYLTDRSALIIIITCNNP